MISSPRRQCVMMASALPIVPLGTKSAASLPTFSAASASRRLIERVLAVDVVADLGTIHRLAHGGRRVRHGVAAQIYRGPVASVPTRDS